MKCPFCNYSREQQLIDLLRLNKEIKGTLNLSKMLGLSPKNTIRYINKMKDTITINTIKAKPKGRIKVYSLT